jgi:hypothetical protein
MALKNKYTTTTKPELRVGKYLPTCLAESLRGIIPDISTLLEILSNY